MESQRDFVDSIESAEWFEIPEEVESKTPLKKIIALKRKSIKPFPVSLPKRSLKVSAPSDDTEDIFTEIDDNPKSPPPPPPPVQKAQTIKFISAKKEVSPLQKLSKKPQLIVAKLLPAVPVPVSETVKASPAEHQPKKPKLESICDVPIVPSTPIVEQIAISKPTETSFDGLKKLENVIERCVQLVEKCISQNNHKQDSNEVFGNYVSSMVRELPADKRNVARVEILQFTGDLIARLSDSM